MRVPKKSIVVLNSNSAKLITATVECEKYIEIGKQKTDEEKCKLYSKIVFYIIMTLSFVAMKVSCWIMIYKFVFQIEENFFGFPVSMFTFTKTFWSVQNRYVNYTNETIKLINL